MAAQTAAEARQHGWLELYPALPSFTGRFTLCGRRAWARNLRCRVQPPKPALSAPTVPPRIRTA
jgi:hypothetical protein